MFFFFFCCLYSLLFSTVVFTSLLNFHPNWRNQKNNSFFFVKRREKKKFEEIYSQLFSYIYKIPCFVCFHFLLFFFSFLVPFSCIQQLWQQLNSDISNIFSLIVKLDSQLKMQQRLLLIIYIYYKKALLFFFCCYIFLFKRKKNIHKHTNKNIS